MKHIIIVPDGMSDLPLKELGGKTPLMAANTPNMDKMAKQGIVGITNNVPKGMKPGSDVANLSLLGYNPKEFYTGRGPFEAKSLGLDLKDGEIAFRCNLVTVEDNKMLDYSAGHISSKEAAVLINHVNDELGTDAISFYPGISYRHILIVDTKKLKETFKKIKCWPPHDILDQSIKKHFPKGNGADFLIDLMQRSVSILKSHEVNKVRLDLNENPANMIWLWGSGIKPKINNFEEKFALKGGLISAVGLLKGIALVIGLDVIDVPGATGYYDTDYSAKAKYGLKSLKKEDFLFLHVEAPDEAGHNGHIKEKIKAIENIDKKIIGPMLDKLNDVRILVSPDHPTPILLRTHTADDVPFIMYGKGIEANKVNEYSENIFTDKRVMRYKKGHELVRDFLTKASIV